MTPISKQCEVMLGWSQSFCGKPTVAGYPAMGGGYMSLCQEHAEKHASITQPIADIEAGVPHPLHVANARATKKAARRAAP